jgi:hypothetical protein
MRWRCISLCLVMSAGLPHAAAAQQLVVDVAVESM